MGGLGGSVGRDISGARREKAVTCDQCGDYTGIDTHCCGKCAEDFNARDRAAGRRRINGRRAKNGLPRMDEEE